MQKETEFEQKNTTFDLGPLCTLKPGLLISDFENSEIDDESLNFLMTAIQRKTYQRFAVNGKLLVKGPHKKNYDFLQPSLHAAASEEDMKDRESIYGEGKVVKALKGLTGIVHDKTEDIRRKAAIEEKNSELLEILNSRVETGFSLECQDEQIWVTNRGGANRSSHDLNRNAKFALHYRESVSYNEENQHFDNKNASTLEYDLGRSAMEPLAYALTAAINKRVNGFITDKKLNNLQPKQNWCHIQIKHPPSGCYSYYYDRMWEQQIRFNKKTFAEYLKRTLYIAVAFSDDAKPGEFWTELSDAKIMWNVLDIADKYNITFNFDEIPPSLPSCKVPFLMCAARRKCADALRMVMMLVENGADTFILDDKNRTVLDYAQEGNNPDVIAYLTGVRSLYNAISSSDIKEIDVHLNSRIIDCRRPITRGFTPIEIAATKKPEVLKKLIPFSVENQMSLDRPLYFAAFKENNLDNVILLLNAGADPKQLLANPESRHIPQKNKLILENWGNTQFIRSYFLSLSTGLSELKKVGKTNQDGLNVKALVKLQFILATAKSTVDYHGESFQVLFNVTRTLYSEAHEIMLSTRQQEEKSTSLFSALFGPRILSEEIGKAIESTRKIFF